MTPFRVRVSGLAFARWNDGERGSGTNHRRDIGNPNRGIDVPDAKVGEIFQRDPGLELHDPLAFPVVVGQYAGTVSGETEPSAVTERVAPAPEFVDPPAEICPDGRGKRPAGLPCSRRE